MLDRTFSSASPQPYALSATRLSAINGSRVGVGVSDGVGGKGGVRGGVGVRGQGRVG